MILNNFLTNRFSVRSHNIFLSSISELSEIIPCNYTTVLRILFPIFALVHLWTLPWNIHMVFQKHPLQHNDVPLPFIFYFPTINQSYSLWRAHNPVSNAKFNLLNYTSGKSSRLNGGMSRRSEWLPCVRLVSPETASYKTSSPSEAWIIHTIPLVTGYL